MTEPQIATRTHDSECEAGDPLQLCLCGVRERIRVHYWNPATAGVVTCAACGFEAHEGNLLDCPAVCTPDVVWVLPDRGNAPFNNAFPTPMIAGWRPDQLRRPVPDDADAVPCPLGVTCPGDHPWALLSEKAHRVIYCPERNHRS